MMKDYFRINKNGIFASLVFIFMVIVSLFIFGFEQQFPPPEELVDVMIIDFGDSENGSGLIEPEREDIISDPVDLEKPVDEAEEEEIMTQDVEESVVVKTTPKQTEKETTEKEVEKEETEVEPQIDPNVLFRVNRDNNSSNEGQGDKEGNQGDPSGHNDGDPNGSPNGNLGGIAQLKGRAVSSLPKPVYNSKEQGKVVVEIKVDRSGTVISATPGGKGTTTSDKGLWEEAKKAALKAKFNKKMDAAEYQLGSITYTFVLQ